MAKYLCPYFQPPQKKKIAVDRKSLDAATTPAQEEREDSKVSLSLFSTASKKKIAVDRKSLDAAATPAPKEKVSLSLFSTASREN